MSRSEYDSSESDSVMRGGDSNSCYFELEIENELDEVFDSSNFG